MKISLSSALEFLKAHDRYVILMHSSPDGDTLGAASALLRALRQLGKKAFAACSDPIPGRYGFLFEDLGDPFGGFIPETVAAVDVADEKLLGDKLSGYAGKTRLCIDHHASNTLFAKQTYLDPSSAATCEIIGTMLYALDIRIDRHIAGAVFTGIATDTGCFRYTNTTPYTHIMAAKMMECGADSARINRVMFETKSRARIEVERAVLQNMEFHFGDRCALVCITKEMCAALEADESELEGITSLPRQIEGVLVGVTVRQRGEKYKISVRTHAPYDASAICRALGGGGHAFAAGCELTGDLSDVKKRILSVVEDFMLYERTASGQ